MSHAANPAAGDGRSILSGSARLSDGRTLAYAEYGDPAGFPLIALHGTPGSRVSMRLWDGAAAARQLRVIAPDRPGYGLSSPASQAGFGRFAADVGELADTLGAQRFAVLGTSGGGPYALACASRHADRVSVAAVVSGIGQLRERGGKDGWARANRIMFALGRASPTLAGTAISRLLRSSLPRLDAQARAGTSPTPDLTPDVLALVVEDQREAIRSGGGGIAYDMRSLWQPWQFDLDGIRCPVCIWHGLADDLAPVALAQRLAARIPGCEAMFYPAEGHTGPLTRHADQILQRVAASAQPRPPADPA